MEGLTAGEAGFLLLTSQLGDPERKPLTAAQLRTLFQSVRRFSRRETDRALMPSDLMAVGYDRDTAMRIVALLDETELLESYVNRGRKAGCLPITRASEGYPVLLRRRLGLDSPGCLWARGDLGILGTPAISLVGSRNIRAENREFAEAVGRQAARQGLALVSGNARGADRAAQDACLQAGGKVISVVADRLTDHLERDNVLYLSEQGYDEGFSAQRALCRNRVIHALGSVVFVAQSDCGKGGTWSGTVKNLRHGWSTVACFRDGSEAALQLEQMGAYLVDRGDLRDFSILPERQCSFFDQ